MVTMDSIIEHVHKLDWTNSIEMQNKAIEVLSEVEEQYINLIFDRKQKSTWKNAVKVIRRIGFPKNKPLLPELLWLLQDVNWPGATEAMDILSSIDKSVVIPLIEDALKLADINDDLMWIGGINLLIKKAGYKNTDFNEISISQILEKADF